MLQRGLFLLTRDQMCARDLGKLLHVSWVMRFELLSPIIFVGRSVLFKQQLWRADYTPDIMDKSSPQPHESWSKGYATLREHYEHGWGYEKWVIKQGRRDYGRLPTGWGSWTIPWKKKRGRKNSKPDEGNRMRKGAEAWYAQVDQGMTRPIGHGRSNP